MFNQTQIDTLNANDVLNVDDAIKNWAESMQRTSRNGSSWQGNGTSNLHYEIHWNKVQIDHLKPQFGDVLPPAHPKMHVLYKATYSNKLNTVQENVFRAERKTISHALMTVSEGVCLSERGVFVPLPDIVAKANAGLPSELSVCQQTSRKWQEEMKWSVDNTITVEPHQTVTAQLMVEEKEWAGNFSITTTMKGKVRVVIRNAQGNVLQNVSGDIREIFVSAR